MDLLVVANPENRRLALFQRAVQARGWPAARVLSHSDLLSGRAALEDHLRPGTCVRIDSAGEDHGVECQILSLGGVEDAASIPEERGRILHPAAWLRGFRRHMESLELAAGQSGACWFNRPSEIALLFDKPRCKERLGTHCLPTLGEFASAEEFLAHLESTRFAGVFVKLPGSSSASGVAAFRWHRATGRQVLRTTMEMRCVGGERRFYNSLRPQVYREPAEICRVLDFLFSQGAFVEPWLPKPMFGGMAWDLRILAVGGKARHRLARLSSGPMTNLHLGNRRMDPAELGLPEKAWNEVERVVEEVMVRLPGCLYAGLDVVVPRSDGEREHSPVVLEANAFGDLLPGLVHQGRDPWEAELDALVAREACCA
ncbi:MAG: STM4014 family protein [Fibrobacteres bacterium]|nr:STM4014 family protein [Fibrobacterota bacterium]